MLTALRRRWALVIFTMLVFLGAGAAWAAAATPVYRSTATIDDPQKVTDIVFAGDAFLNRLDELRSSPETESLQVTVRRADNRVHIEVDALTGEQAVAIADLHTTTALDASRTTRVLDAPDFPLSPASPNLRTIALVTGIAGLVAGLIAAVALDRFSAAASPDLDLRVEPAAVTQPLPAPKVEPVDQLVIASWSMAPAADEPLVVETQQRAPRVGPTPPRAEQPAIKRRSDVVPRIVELPDDKPLG